MNILNFEAQEIDSLEEIIERQKAIMFSFEPNLEKRVEVPIFLLSLVELCRSLLICWNKLLPETLAQ